MKKITVVVPKKKSRKLKALLKKEELNKYSRTPADGQYRFELIVTPLKSEKLIEKIRTELEIHAGKPSKDGYITVSQVDFVAPYAPEKSPSVALEASLLKDARDFIRLDRNYLIFILSSAIIACIGFQTDSLAVVIGAMVIGPLMNPIMAVSFGWSIGNDALVRKGLRNEILGIGLILLASLLMGIFPNPSLGLELSFAGASMILGLLLAMVVGLVAATSFLTGGFEAQTGVAISVALIPPLTNFALLLIGNQVLMATRSLIIFLLSIAGMHLSSFAAFRLIGAKKS